VSDRARLPASPFSELIAKSCIHPLQKVNAVLDSFDSAGFYTMKSQELASLAGISSQWLNKLLDRRGIPGVSRKQNGRLEVYNEEQAAKWAAAFSVPKRRKPICVRKPDEWDLWVAKGRSLKSREARWEIEQEVRSARSGRRIPSPVPRLAKKFKLSRQGIYQAIARLDRRYPWAGIQGMLLFRYDS
jgi:hypothetical protein